MTEINSTGFTISAKCCSSYTGKNYVDISSHEFTAPLDKKDAVQKEMISLKSKSRIVSWPPGYGAIVSALILIGCLTCTADINNTVTSIYVQKIRMVSMLLLRSTFNARVAVALIFVAHSVEGLFVASICRKLHFNKFQLATWVSMVILIGYPCTSRILYLEKMLPAYDTSSGTILTQREQKKV